MKKYPARYYAIRDKSQSSGEIYAILSTDSNASVRDAFTTPTFNLKTNIFDRILNNISYKE